MKMTLERGLSKAGEQSKVEIRTAMKGFGRIASAWSFEELCNRPKAHSTSLP